MNEEVEGNYLMVLESSLDVREVGLAGIVEQCYEQIGIVEIALHQGAIYIYR